MPDRPASTLRRLWRDHRALLLAFLLALAVTLFFIGRLAVSALYWASPANHDVAIKPWMTPGYIARSYRVKPDVVFTAIPYQPVPGKPRSIAEIAAETGTTPAEVTAAIARAIAAERARTAA